ncbi:tyrosine-type recombinase/integrase [Bacillus sp. JJ1562]|uniref:tyrosine-type recombinase/integrase n=1 Tax=Bacillus sp. JJ1562 TaxID=3122960 RepID=UPI00300169E9
MNEKKYQIFISSTYTDLIKAREVVTTSILTMYHFPVGMEMFSAGDDDQWTVIKRTIDISDYYVLIIGHRYGSVTAEGISYTEKEYNYARQKGIPILTFIKDREASTKPFERETNIKLQEKLNSFIDKTMESRMCDFWENEEQLSSKVTVALMKEFNNNPRPGWIRNSQILSKNHIIEDAVNAFLDEKERMGLKKSSLNAYKYELDIFSEYYKDKFVKEIDVGQIKNYLRYREDNFNITSKGTMEFIRGKLKLFFDWIVEENLTPVNPVKKIRPYMVPDAIVDTLNEVEIDELRNACNTARERAIIEILLSTGCQLGEMKKLNLNSINWENNTIKIIGSRHRNRVVKLTESAAEHLKKYLDTREDNKENLFVTVRKPNNSLGARSIEREINEIASRTSIDKKITPKTFRHTFAKLMLAKGYQLNKIQALLGNKNLASTSETYVKLTDENINEIFEYDL